MHRARPVAPRKIRELRWGLFLRREKNTHTRTPAQTRAQTHASMVMNENTSKKTNKTKIRQNVSSHLARRREGEGGLQRECTENLSARNREPTGREIIARRRRTRLASPSFFATAPPKKIARDPSQREASPDSSEKTKRQLINGRGGARSMSIGLSAASLAPTSAETRRSLPEVRECSGDRAAGG